MVDGKNTGSNVTFAIDANRRLIRITIRNTISDADLLELDARRRQTPEFKNGFAVLSECLDVSARLTWKGIYKLAAVSHNDCNRVAIVTNNPAIFVMACTYQICANWKDDRVAVFGDAQAALEWIESK